MTTTTIDESTTAALLKSALSCVHCALCYQALPSLTRSDKFADTCPAGMYYKFDAYYSAGRNEIARAILRNEFPLSESEKLKEIVFSCTTCGACEINCRYACDTNVLPVHITEAIRALLVQKGIGPLDSQKGFAEHVKKLGNPYGEPGERNSWIENKESVDKKGQKYFYFVGCTTGYRMPGIARATSKILGRFGDDFTVSSKELCCGSPLLRTGQVSDVRRLVEENIREIKDSGATEVVFSCAGCYRTAMRDWPRIMGTVMPFKMTHMSQYLAEKLKKTKVNFKNLPSMKVAYHDPCHLGRHMFPNQVYDEPRFVIDALPGIQRIGLDREKDSTLCCGAGGGVKTGIPEFSEHVASLRIEEARARGADAMVTTCPFCVRGLSDGVKKGNGGRASPEMKVLELTELVASALEDD